MSGKAFILVITGLLAVQINCFEAATKTNERSIRIRGVIETTSDKPVVYPKNDDDSDVSQAVPERLLINMRNLKNVDDFLNFLDPNTQPGAGSNYNGSQEEGVNINGSDGNATSWGIDARRRNPLSATLRRVLAQAAGCEVEMQAVELERPVDPSIVLWPKCTRLPRCGGCCSSSLLECVPTKVTKAEIKVIRARYTGKANSQFQIMDMTPLKVEHHEKCECQCRQKPEHCTPLQTYKVEECKCICENELLRKSCAGSDHVWDSKECVCKCRQVRECSTGYFYNIDSCKCEVFGRSSRIGSPQINSRIGRPTIATRVSTSGSASSSAQGVGDFGQPMTHLNGGERSKLEGDVHVNIKPYDMEPFTLAQTRRANRGRPVFRVPVKELETQSGP